MSCFCRDFFFFLHVDVSCWSSLDWCKNSQCVLLCVDSLPWFPEDHHECHKLVFLKQLAFLSLFFFTLIFIYFLFKACLICLTFFTCISDILKPCVNNFIGVYGVTKAHINKLLYLLWLSSVIFAFSV